MITAAILFIWNTLKAIGDVLRESPIARYIAFGVGVTILIGCFFLFRGCKSETEKRIEARDPVIVEQEQAANNATAKAEAANVEAKNAQDESNKAQANVIKVQRDKQSNVTVDAANRNRCLAYPDSAGCK